MIAYSFLWGTHRVLRSANCHMGSHSVTCHPTRVNAPHLNPSHTGRYLIYLPRRDGRLSWSILGVGYRWTEFDNIIRYFT